jgi:N-acetylmuramoyl-L-alanine amidase
MEIKQKLIPASNKKARPKTPMKAKYITIHETDNTNKGADALAHAKLQYNGNVRNASWHFQVDDKEIYQSIPTNEIAWANGDGSRGTGNTQSISVEICVNSDGDFTKAKENAAWLVRYLMDKHGIPLSNVVQHNKWSGKNCPRNIRKSGWNALINQIKSGSVATVSNGNRLLKLTNPYMSGDDVKKVQQIIGVTIDGVYGPLTMNAVTKFQKAHGLATDGIVGDNTWNALLAPPPAPFYDCVINGASKATFSARDIDEIVAKVRALLEKKTNKIELNKRT